MGTSDPGLSSGYDVVVVGSGYGGAIATCRLAQAGVNVCLLEKGKAWQSHEFPTSVGGLLWNMKFHTPFGSFGRRNSLYEVCQVLLQRDSISLSASGLGGGSLVNAGVIVPTPKRVRNGPKWPKEWEEDWEIHEARRDAVIQQQNVPHDFPKTQMMEKLAHEIEDVVQILKESQLGIHGDGQRRRRWRVYLNLVDYVSADYVVLACTRR